MDLCSELESLAAKGPGLAALIFRDESTSYGDLCSKVRRCAAGLAGLGVKRGDRFALVMRNCPDFVIVYHALLRIGAIPVPVNFMLKPTEAAYIFEHSGAVGAAAQEKFVPMVREAGRGIESFRHIICTESSHEDTIALSEILSSTAEAPPR